MSDLRAFFEEIDRLWKDAPPGKTQLKVIGSAALLLQTDYARGTKDGDVLETLQVTPQVKAQLLGLAGKGTAFHKRMGLYLDIVLSGLPFLPHPPKFHPQEKLSASLDHLEISVLDVVDVVVSKLKRFNVDDAGDVGAMVDRGLVNHPVLLERFRAAVEAFSTDARADDLPKIVKNLHRIERDMFRVPESDIELPGWI